MGHDENTGCHLERVGLRARQRLSLTVLLLTDHRVTPHRPGSVFRALSSPAAASRPSPASSTDPASVFPDSPEASPLVASEQVQVLDVPGDPG